MLHNEDDLMLDSSSVENYRTTLLLRPRTEYNFSEIWIPSHLLKQSKFNSLNSEEPFNRTLGNVQKLPSFSTYSDSEEEIEDCGFQNDLICNLHEYDKLNGSVLEGSNTNLHLSKSFTSSNNLSKIYDSLEDSLKGSVKDTFHAEDISDNLKQVEPQLSEHCIVDAEIKHSDFDYIPFYDDDANYSYSTLKSKNVEDTCITNKKKGKKSQKKKEPKSLPLGHFLQTEGEEKYQEPEVDLFLEGILNRCRTGRLDMRSVADFPMLTSKPDKPIFVKSENKYENKQDIEPNIKSIVNDLGGHLVLNNTNKKTVVNNCDEDLMYANSDNKVNCDEEPNRLNVCEEITKNVKIVIENVPMHVTCDELLEIMYNYGEIKEQPILKETGMFKSFRIRMDVIGDVEWIIDCLDGTQPFGESPRSLKCYREY